MDLPAFLLSKNFYSESIGMPRSAVLTAALSNLTALRSRQINWLGACLVGLIRPRCGLAFQLCLPQLSLSFCLVL